MKNKGITLVALIITIVILLILAVVAISAVTGNGITEHAKNARDLYGAKSEEENTLLQNYLEQLNKEINDGSSSDDDKEVDDKITFTMDGKQYQVDNKMTFEEFLKTSSYTSNPLTIQKKCSNCGKDISLKNIDGTYGYYSSDDTVVPHIRLYSNTDLYIKSGNTISPNPINNEICAGSVLQSGIIITLVELCSL